ncbi:MAG: hypothetical protein HY427_02875 [Candidatus Levybacteria bacterium]|nr:hypothetical protein [Candidatus Levybacteria bacterium]
MQENQIPPPPPLQTGEPTKVSTNIESVLLGIISMLLLIGAIFIALNYFDIISISKTVPFLSFLPKQKTQNVEIPPKTIIPASQVTPKPEIISGCPVREELCSSGGVLILSEKDKISSFSGIVYSNLVAGEKILSVIAGDIQVENLVSDEKTLVTITDKESGLQANYEFPIDAFELSASSSTISKRGEIIGVISDGSKSFKNLGGGYDNLIFSLQDLATKLYIKIKPATDGKSILLI